MIKYSSKASQALRDLQTGLSIMLQVLKSLNDSLHVVGLKGFPVSIIHLCTTAIYVMTLFRELWLNKGDYWFTLVHVIIVCHSCY